MATEIKRPARPLRRRSDIPLGAAATATNLQNEARIGNMKTLGFQTAVASDSLPDEDDDSVEKDTGKDDSLEIVEDFETKPSEQTQQLTKVSLRQVRPKERHKTLSSEFPTIEFRKKGDVEGHPENTRPVESLLPSALLTEKHVSTEPSFGKPLIKPKPQLHHTTLLNLAQQNTGQQSNGQLVTNKQGTSLHGNCLVSTSHSSSDHRNAAELKSDQEDVSNCDNASKPDVQTSGCSMNDSLQTIGQQNTSLSQDLTQRGTSHENCNQQGGSDQESLGNQLRSTKKDSVVQNSSHEADLQPKTGHLTDETMPDSGVDDASSPFLKSDSSVPELQGLVALYARVDKKRRPKTNEVDGGRIRPGGILKFSNESTDLVGVPQTNTGVLPVPPKKPPRTFAHNEYMRLKAMESSSPSPVAITGENEYEEIEHPTTKADKAMNSQPDDAAKRNSFGQSDGVESAKNDPVKRRSTGDKLPAPPRPPPPSIVHKTGTLPLKDHRETSPSNSESFLRGTSSGVRRSDRGFWGVRKSKSPDAGKVDQKKAVEKKSKDKKQNTSRSSFYDGVEEDIYAEPAELNVAVAQLPLDSSFEDPFYEVPGGTKKSQVLTPPIGDTSGCPVSESPNKPSRQASVPLGSQSASRPKGICETKTSRFLSDNKPTRARISSAYSILRLNIESTTEANRESHENADEDSDSEVTKDEHEQRLKHISNVRKRTSHQVANYVRVKLNKPSHLFEFALIVGLEMDENKKCCPKVLFQYPEKLADGISTDRVEQFCFPDAEIWRPVTIYDGEMFSFLLTNQFGTRQYGFCRRFLPPGRGNRLPAALCIVSLIGEVFIYERLLRSVEERFLVAQEHAQDLLHAAYSHLCPEPNQEVFIVTGSDGKKQSMTLRRAGEARPDNVSCDALLNYLPTNILIKVFGSVLLERRLIFCAQKLSTLTSCVHTILSLLYPFEWQHILIPVLPSSMIDVLGAPTPYVVGILSSTYAKLLQKEALNDEILVVDLDGGSLLHTYGDEEHIIPEKLRKALSTAMKDDSDSVGMRDAATAEAFLRFFIETCGHYTDFISTQPDGQPEFDVDQFTGAVASRSIQMFLEWFTGTQMFEVFKTEELHGMKHEMFLSRIMEYREEMTEMTSSLRQNMKLMRKKIKHFFIESGGKLRRKFQRNVFI